MTHILKRLFRRREKGEYVLIKRKILMQLNNALDAALVQAEADKKTISNDAALIATLQAQPAGADPVKAKALADAVLGVDSATLPDPAPAA